MARSYAAVRPRYPDELYAYLASLIAVRDVAWDVATGNGQAAIGLATHVPHVIATDASAAQIAAAIAHPRVEYRVARAEESELGAHTIDLITVAQAVHWFDLDAFYREVVRVARPHALLAIWSYGYFAMTPDIDDIINRFSEGKLLAYWPAASRVIRDRYRTLLFPFAEVDVPSFTMEQRFTLAELELYFRSWSAVQRYIDATGEDPVPAVIEEIAAVWGGQPTARIARFELFLRAGRIAPN